MASSPRERVLRALDALLPYLHGFVHQAFEGTAYEGKRIEADIGPLAHAIRDAWRGVFTARLDGAARNYVHELLDIRNRLSHSKSFDDDEARRACDTIRLLAKAIGAPLREYDRRVADRTAVPPAPRLTSATRTIDSSAMISRNGMTPGRRPSQRDMMRAIWSRYAPDEARAISEYAATELRGEVLRKQNASGLDSEQYARALLADGLKKGWL